MIADAINDYLESAGSQEADISRLELDLDDKKAEAAVYSTIIALAEERPGAHPALMRLVRQLCVPHEEASDQYTEVLSDAHDSLLGDVSNYLCKVGSRIPDEPWVKRWVNLSAFLASCEQAGLPSLGWRYAICSIAPGLEAVGGSHETIGKMDVFGASSAHWLIKNPAALYQACKETQETQRWGMGKYSLERWARWKSRLEALRNRDELAWGSRELMGRARFAMDEVERL